MTVQILIVDDDPVQRRLLEAQVQRMGYLPRVCDGGPAALQAIESDTGDRIAALVLDLMMPGMSGLDVMAALRSRASDVPIVVQTAIGSIDTVVEAMRAGAFDFVVKPASPDKLKAAIDRAIKVGKAGRQARHRRPMQIADAGVLQRPESAAMRPVLQDAARAAGSSIPILIEGETGAGKEWLAEAIRAAGPRAAAPFITVNCGALPAQLTESILFGHEKGAFTGATERHAGRFLEADGGTLFLDEVGELPADAQVKLLRVLQRGEVDPVGGKAPIKTNVRIISATNRDLAEAVRSGQFREDLYYRLNVLPIRMPPLRERREEIARLANRFLRHFVALEGGREPRSLSPAAERVLVSYDWPGNIRQLANALHRAVVLSESRILGPDDFPQVTPFLQSSPPFDLPDLEASPVARLGEDGAATPAADVPSSPASELSAFDASGALRTAEAVEADLIRIAIAHCGGRMTDAAVSLGIGRSTLYRKMRQYGIDESPLRRQAP